MSTVISVEHVSKSYRLGQIGGGTLKEDVSRWWAKLRGQPDPFLKIGEARKPETGDRKPSLKSQVSSLKSPPSDLFWALQDVSFEVKQGEVLGIIGRNGAGKSTLLKILSQVTTPTSGEIKIKGRIASLLEVGTGFHPELTGRENIFLNGAILGMTKAEIRKKFDEIVDFSGVEEFIDTPVKRYSSGMYVRLAFAVAAHLEPEILICDEVLAVGDAQFQKKCLGKMQDVSAREGRTVLFVSHNMPSVLQLTTTAILLNSGRIIYNGSSDEAVKLYMDSGETLSALDFDVENAPRKYEGTRDARFLHFRLLHPSPILSPKEDLCFMARVRANRNIAALRISMTIFGMDGSPVGSSFSPDYPGIEVDEEIDVEVKLPCPNLAPGFYCCGIGMGKGNNLTGHIDYDVVLDTLNFEVRPPEGEAGTVGFWVKVWGSVVFREMQVQFSSK